MNKLLKKCIGKCGESVTSQVFFLLLSIVCIVINYRKADMNMLIFWSILCGCNIMNTIMVIAKKNGYVMIKFDKGDKNDRN